jgi:hypothetical protein
MYIYPKDNTHMMVIVLCMEWQQNGVLLCGSSNRDLYKVQIVHEDVPASETQQTLSIETTCRRQCASSSSSSFYHCKQSGFGAIRNRPDNRIFATGGWDHAYVSPDVPFSRSCVSKKKMSITIRHRVDISFI